MLHERWKIITTFLNKNSETEENKTDNDVVFGSYTLGDDYFETQSTGVFFLVFFF